MTPTDLLMSYRNTSYKVFNDVWLCGRGAGGRLTCSYYNSVILYCCLRLVMLWRTKIR